MGPSSRSLKEALLATLKRRYSRCRQQPLRQVPPIRDLPPNLAFTRYSFAPKVSCTIQSSSSQSALLTLLQYYCTTNVQYTTPTRPPVCMQYTIPYWPWQYRV